MAPRPAQPPTAPPRVLEGDDARTVVVGTVLWGVGLVVLLVLSVTGAVEVRGWWLGMCAYGVALGLVGTRYVRRREAALARDRSR